MPHDRSCLAYLYEYSMNKGYQIIDHEISGFWMSLLLQPDPTKQSVDVLAASYFDDFFCMWTKIQKVGVILGSGIVEFHILSVMTKTLI